MYKEQTDNELKVILEKYQYLTFPSQIELKKELNKRDLVESKNLNSSINNKITEIKKFKFLKNLGFKIRDFGDSIQITRTTKAILIDILASILGLLFIVRGLVSFISLIQTFFSEKEFKLSGFVFNIILLSLGVLGIRMLNGIKRLIDYAGFKLTVKNEMVTLKKRFDLKLIEIEKNSTFLKLEDTSDQLILKLENDQIMNTNSKNLLQKMTIVELIERLKK